MPDIPKPIQEIDARIQRLAGTFLREAAFQGKHFRYAVRGTEILIEIRRTVTGPDGARENRFFYWLLCSDGMRLIHASKDPRGGSMSTIGEMLDGLIGQPTPAPFREHPASMPGDSATRIPGVDTRVGTGPGHASPVAADDPTSRTMT